MKSDIIQALHSLIHERLFGSRPWLADREVAGAVYKKLKVLGLNEFVSGTSDTRATALGREVDIDLMEVFMGVWAEHEIPFILEDYGLISEGEMLVAEKRLEKEDPEAVLLPLVRRAFFQHFRAGARLN